MKKAAITTVGRLWEAQKNKKNARAGLVGVAHTGNKLKRLGGDRQTRGPRSVNSIGASLGCTGEWASKLIAGAQHNLLGAMAESEARAEVGPNGEPIDWHAELEADPSLLAAAFAVCRARDELRRLEKLLEEGRLEIVDSGTAAEGFVDGIKVVTPDPSGDIRNPDAGA